MYDDVSTFRRAEKGLMAKFLAKTMPPDPHATFVWPQLAVDVGRKHFRARSMILIALALLAMTVGLLYLLLQIPFLDLSVVTLLTRGFEAFIPKGWATGVAWVAGMTAVLSAGRVTNYTRRQRKLMSKSATRSEAYNLLLMAALLEEQVFRSGSEQWTWRQRVYASLMFGVIHITNIWYNFAAGIALSLTGFGFMLVYQWYYQRTKSQVAATAASATVHATYNLIAIVAIMAFLAKTIVDRIL